MRAATVNLILCVLTPKRENYTTRKTNTTYHNLHTFNQQISYHILNHPFVQQCYFQRWYYLSLVYYLHYNTSHHDLTYRNQIEVIFQVAYVHVKKTTTLVNIFGARIMIIYVTVKVTLIYTWCHLWCCLLSCYKNFCCCSSALFWLWHTQISAESIGLCLVEKKKCVPKMQLLDNLRKISSSWGQKVILSVNHCQALITRVLGNNTLRLNILCNSKLF